MEADSCFFVQLVEDTDTAIADAMKSASRGEREARFEGTFIVDAPGECAD